MTDKEKRELKDGVISIFKRFHILDYTATIGGLRDDILRYIGSLQEEPETKFKIGDRIRLKGTTVKGDIITNIYQAEDGNTYFEFENSDDAPADCDWELVEEPVSKNMDTDIAIRLGSACHKQVWHENQFSKEDCKAYCSLYKECQECSLDFCMIFFHDPHCHFEEEPVSEDLEEAASEWDSKASFSPFYMVMDGDNPIDVKQDITTHAESFKAGAQWQKQKDEHLIWQISSANYEKGKQEAREEMMKDAIKAEVRSKPNDYGEYMPEVIVPVSYSYRVGDKVKLIIIKED